MTFKTYVNSRPRPRTIAEIAEEIAEDWDEYPSEADELITGLRTCDTVHDTVHGEPARDLILALLRLAREWTGDVSIRIKRELRGKLGLL